MSRIIFVAAALSLSVATGRADDKKPAPIEFDTKLTFPCRDVTPKEFKDANPGLKIVEATIQISANFQIEEKEIHALEYNMRMPGSFKRIADYLPKTELIPVFAGTIDTQQGTSEKSSVVVRVEGGGKVSYKSPFDILSGEANVAGRRDNEGARQVNSGVQMRLLPPKQLITAVGTKERGGVLYFKLRPFSTITLEGDKEFAFLAVVPTDWSADCMTLECTAYRKGYDGVVAKQNLPIGLFLTGDPEAQTKAEKLARAEVKPTAPRTPMTEGGQAAEQKTELSGNQKQKGYVGMFELNTTGGFKISLNEDGTWDSVIDTTYDSADQNRVKKYQRIPRNLIVEGLFSNGAWSVRGNILLIENVRLHTFGEGKIRDFEKKIVDFDPLRKQRIIKLEDGWVLTELAGELLPGEYKGENQMRSGRRR